MLIMKSKITDSRNKVNAFKLYVEDYVEDYVVYTDTMGTICESCDWTFDSNLQNHDSKRINN